ncbi:leucyl aminopeptidase (aminopeptidase T) [Halovivax ruber XH-70]|uniref:Leucyl aminopeptidase (Aminopeptidase T) n=1 Tax=Halovivax ruber (strain DSM 18193 / JCM 13892 / XH-70) TaxID=797302 RepID=L0IDY0_HALRX|nr:aminopeptidase [Halovivax ruber]AGB16964.1 leucyl aminopeptidase (aminopeptidase T) [Halovivax ruber XH-70]
MDSRVEDHARIIADHSVDIQPGDEVLIQAPAAADELVVALHEEIGARGAFPLVMGTNSSATRAFMRAMDPDAYDDPPQAMLAMWDELDAIINIGGHENTYERSDIDPETNTAFATLMQPLSEKMTEKRWVTTQYPAPADAQAAEMSTEAYEDFVWDAVNKDWEAVREYQAQLVDILESGSEVRIVSGDSTDVTMRIDDMIVQNDYAEKNLPGGEVYTAPIPDSVEGEVLFDKPLMAQGREVSDVRLRFEGGEIVDHDAGKNEDALAAILDTDPGARRLGELGIGMNRDIDRFTTNMLFDEKMGDTVHMAIGRAYEETVPDDHERNDSAIHLDMIVDMSEDSHIEVDGERIQENGTFEFEE